MSRSSRLLWALVLIGVVRERPSWASTEERNDVSGLKDLSYEAPPECPDEERLQERVHALVQSVASNDAPLRIHLRIQRLGSSDYSATLQVDLQSGEGLRQFGGPNCGQLVEASAWMIALVLHPSLELPRESPAVASFPLDAQPERPVFEADTRSPKVTTQDAAVAQGSTATQNSASASDVTPETESTNAPSERHRALADPIPIEPAAAHTDPSPSSLEHSTPRPHNTARSPGPPRAKQGAQFALLGVLDMGMFRAVAPGVAANMGLSFATWNPQLELSYLPSKSITAGELSGRFWMLSAALRLCRRATLHPVWFTTCVGLEGGAIHGVAVADNPRPSFGPWLAPAVTVGLSVPLGPQTPSLSALLRLHGAVPLIRDEFQQDRTTIYRPPPALVRVEIGIEHQF